MKTCAFLTMDDLAGFVSDDELAYAPLEALGWRVTPVSWRQTALPWNTFDAAILRTTWDYQKDPHAFLDALEAIDRATRLENSLRLVRWNMHKTYLRDLAGRGVRIVPTRWGNNLTPRRLDALFETLDADELVLKPAVGANADDTFRLPRTANPATRAQVATVFNGRDYMAQPFMPGIVDEGEFSLFFFGDAYSHTILKTPKPDDFRVQEEHGGLIRAVAAEPRLLEQAQAALHAVHPVPLYARVDLVRDRTGFAVMELELIEPSLYLRMDAEAPARFARALDTWMQAER